MTQKPLPQLRGKRNARDRKKIVMHVFLCHNQYLGVGFFSMNHRFSPLFNQLNSQENAVQRNKKKDQKSTLVASNHYYFEIQ
jgi:hypothetical protein